MKKIVFISVLIFCFSIKSVIASNIPGVQTPLPIVSSQPGSSGNCPASYFTYQQALKEDAPTLADLFDGKAHFQNIAESQIVNLQFDANQIDTGYANGQPSKLPILFNQTDGKYYAYSRAFSKNPGPDGNKHFNMYLLSSTDGVNFTQVAPIFSQSVIDETGDKLDGHIAIDYLVCPVKYYMALEGGGSMWASSSTDPFNPSSWSRPVSVVGYDLAGHKSASTGVFLIDGNNKYTSWTVVDDGPLGMNKDHDTGGESAYSRAILANNLLSYLGSSGIGTVVLPAEQNTHCNSSWDCNNRDKQDWKKEGNYYYLIYNGGNYYRCTRFFPKDTAPVDWGNGIVRSANPLSGYDLKGVGKMQQSLNTSICAVSYPVINAVAGELYMYYAYNNVPYDGGQKSLVARSKLVWNSVDIVDILDLRQLLANFTSIFDYNKIVEGFGK